jgi:hypothetical protein
MPKTVRRVKKISKKHKKCLSTTISLIFMETRLTRYAWDTLCDYLVTQRDAETPLTVPFIRELHKRLRHNKKYFDDKDMYEKIYNAFSYILETLVDKIRIPKTDCSICYAKNVTHHHCARCIGVDTVVCKKCIVNMFQIEPEIDYVWYRCPHCREHLEEPKWTNTHCGALRAIRGLQAAAIRRPEEDD